MTGDRIKESVSSNPRIENGPGSATVVILLVAFVGLGAFLRLYHFWSPDLWLDEYVTQWIVQAGTWQEVVQRSGVNHTQSPFYYLMVKAIIEVFGSSMFSLRLLSVVFGIASVALAYPLGLRFFRRRLAALFTVAVFAVNSKLIWFSQDARCYSLALFCSLLSFLCYLALLSDGRWRWRVGYVLSTTAAYYAHPMFAVIALVQLSHLVFIHGPSLRSTGWPLTFAAVAALCLPTLPRMFTLYENRQGLDWLSNLTWATPINIPAQFVDPLALMVIVVMLLVVGLRTGEQEMLSDRMQRSLIVLWLLLPVALVSTVPPLFGVALLSERYVLYALPGALLLLAWVMSLGATGPVRRWLPLMAYLIFIIGAMLLPLFQKYGVFAERPRQGWQQAAAYLTAFARRDDSVLYSTGLVEADQLALSGQNALMEAFIQYPLTAHLPSDHAYTMVALPYRINHMTRPYVASILSNATQHHRIWLIGIGDPLIQMADELSQVGFRRVDAQQFGSLSHYGQVMVFLLERDGEASGKGFSS